MDNNNPGRVILFHGIKTPNRNRRIHRFARAFRQAGFEVVVPYYGYIPAIVAGLFGWLDHRLADTIASFIREDDILVGYSNGATIVYMISQRVKVRGAVLVNAALKSGIAPRAGFIHVYYNEGDWVTGLANLVPFHLWGSMGRDGYTGINKNVESVNQGVPPLGLPSLSGHTDVLDHPNILPWSRYMAARCLEEVQLSAPPDSRNRT